jgi:hypothetical protein
VASNCQDTDNKKADASASAFFLFALEFFAVPGVSYRSRLEPTAIFISILTQIIN